VSGRRQARTAVFGVSAAVFGTLLFLGLARLPAFGSYEGAYGLMLNKLVVPARHVTNVVGGVVFDVRALDTMGEEFILFTAVMGTALLLRETRDEDADRPQERVESEAVRLLGLPMVAVTVLLGLWLVAFGYITPGGGFQGGVVLAGALLLLWAAGSYRAYRRASPPHFVELGESVGAGGFVVIGLAAMLSGLAFLETFLDKGVTGTLKSGGSIAFLNWAAGIEVAGAMVLLFQEFLEEHAPTLRRAGR
jgi:multicomponent Na+:H+ antiporter subunit B